MLDSFTVATKGGRVLWAVDYFAADAAAAAAVRDPGGDGRGGGGGGGGPAANPVDALFRTVLVEERAGLDSYTTGPSVLRWSFVNGLNIIFVVVYQKILQLPYVDELLSSAKTLFCKTFAEELKDPTRLHSFASFDEVFDRLLQQLESKQHRKAERFPRAFKDTKKGRALQQNAANGSTAATEEENDPPSGHVADAGGEISRNARRPLAGARRRMPKSVQGGRKAAGKVAAAAEDAGVPASKKGGKRRTVWSADGQMMELDDAEVVLDYSAGGEGERAVGDGAAAVDELVDKGSMGKITGREGFYEVADLGGVISEEDEDEDETVAPPRAAAGTARTTEGGVFSFFKNFAGARALTEKDLELVLGKTKEHLIKKNVAADIAQHLCDSVGRSVVGQKLGAFNSVQKTVKASMAHALRKILTPKTSTDVLRDIVAARAEKRPYVVTFIGVNGVGKSTNLAKTCFWLLQNNFRVLIAACDTFRSGAVEQLRVHARNLRALSSDVGNVELFERGYGKDSAGIAREAIAYAKKNGFDVVLIDTAGRMQDNEPLMRALAKLVSTNDPDKIIFVGEALVGNEAVDQLRKFNRALKDFSGTANPRQIDGMILTKFDTIDDKVGAALSMTYTTGQPILFVGTGQTYTDLKTMRVEHIVQSLLKD